MRTIEMVGSSQIHLPNWLRNRVGSGVTVRPLPLLLSIVCAVCVLPLQSAVAQMTPAAGGAIQQRQGVTADITTPLGILEGRVRNDLIHRAFQQAGQQLRQKNDGLTPAEISVELRKADQRSSVRVPTVVLEDQSVYHTMAKSSLLLGTVYDCGRCPKMHVSVDVS